jgi:hypothetical protein
MASLFSYMKQTQRFIRDSRQQTEDPGDLIEYINQARRETAMRAQCIRVLPPISGAIEFATVTTAGSGYTAPVVTVSPPDSPSGFLPNPNGAQAIVSVQLVGGQIISANVVYGGAGYFMPQVTITDPTGSGAAISLGTTVNNTLKLGQEVYPFSGIDLSYFPGVESIYLVRSVSVIYSNYRYSLPVYSFSTYQAMIRQYVASQFQYVPTFGAQFGQGTNGSFYLYPPPSQTYQLEWDCQCLPQDLVTDQSVEAIADPWTDAVPYYAAHLVFLGQQNFNAARAYLDLYDQRMTRFRAYVQPGRATNPYGRF